MKRIQSDFKGYKLTNQPGGKHNLVIIVANDMHASMVYQTLSMSGKLIFEYNLSDDYFDLKINMPLTQEFYELNYHKSETSLTTAYAIDNSLITAIWVGYPLSDKLTLFGNQIDL